MGRWLPVIIALIIGWCPAWSREDTVPLVVHYNMEPDPCAPGRLADAGGVHLDGVLGKGVNYIKKGRFGQGLLFSGKEEDCVRLEQAGLLNKLGGPVTISAWVKPGAFPGRAQAMFLTKYAESNDEIPFALGMTHEGELLFEGHNSKGEEIRMQTRKSVFKRGVWTHIAVVYAAGDQVVLYVNGLGLEKDDAALPLSVNDKPLILGYNGEGMRFNGIMDEVRIYAAALSKEQIRADMSGNLVARTAVPSDIPIPKLYVDLHLVRYDRPRGFAGQGELSRSPAIKRDGPDAVDWPVLQFNGSPIFQQQAREGRSLPLQKAVSTGQGQNDGDAVLQPGSHWLRAIEDADGSRRVYTEDSTARCGSKDYELWVFPVLIQGIGREDVKDIELKAEGQVIYRRAGPLRSLLLLLPQNRQGSPYELTVAGRGPVKLDVGLQPVEPERGREVLRPINLMLPGAGPSILIRNLHRPREFPGILEWKRDLIRLEKVRKIQGERAKLDPQAAGLVAYYPMNPGTPGEQTNRLVDLGPLKLPGRINEGLIYTIDSHKGKALFFGGDQAGAWIDGKEPINRLSNHFSILMWIKPRGLPEKGRMWVLAAKQGADWGKVPFALLLNDKGELVFEADDGSREGIKLVSRIRLKKRHWQQVGFSYECGGQLCLYIGGKCAARRPVHRPLVTNGKPLNLGWCKGGKSRGKELAGYKGGMDEVYIFSQALTREQIEMERNGLLKMVSPTRLQNAVPLPYGISSIPGVQSGIAAKEIIQSPLTIFTGSSEFKEGKGFYFYPKGQHDDKRLSLEDYTADLAQAGYDVVWEHVYPESRADVSLTPAYERWLMSLAEYGIKGGLEAAEINNPAVRKGTVWPAWYAGRYRDWQLIMQRYGRYANFAGVVLSGPDSFCADWITAIQEVCPQAQPLVRLEGATKKEKGRGRQWATLANQVSLPQRDELHDMPIVQLGEDVFSGVSPGYGLAVIDCIRSYYPDKPVWAVAQTYPDRMSRQFRQSLSLLLLSRGINGIGSNWIAHSRGSAGQRQILTEQKDWFAWMHKYGGVFVNSRSLANVGILYVAERDGRQSSPLTKRDGLQPSPQAGRGSLQQISRQPGPAGGSGMPHAAKVVRALELCYAAGWPARIITPEELTRGLSQEIKCIFLAGLSDADSSRHWYEGIKGELDEFTRQGGLVLVDDESVSPVAMVRTDISLAAEAASVRGDWAKGPVINQDNIKRLQRVMEGISGRLAWSSNPGIWVVPFKTGDVVYLVVVNAAYTEDNKGVLNLQPLQGVLKADTDRTIYDLQTGRRLDFSHGIYRVELQEAGFRIFALLPKKLGKLKIKTTNAEPGFCRVVVDVGTKAGIKGLPVQVVLAGKEAKVTAYGISGREIRLAVALAKDGTRYKLSATELLTGQTIQQVWSADEAVPGPMQGNRRQRVKLSLQAFFARKNVPVTVALTPEQAKDKKMAALVDSLVKLLQKRQRKVHVGEIVPNGVILSLQPYAGVQRYPQWHSIDSDLVIFGSVANNPLLLDQARGFLLPREILRQNPAEGAVWISFSPFAGGREVLNITGGNREAVEKAAGQILQDMSE